MTFDHLGIIIYDFFPDSQVFYTICRYIGRFALPLFCFMIVEGVIHTKNIKKYLLRLGIMAVAISIVLSIAQFATGLGLYSLSFEGNIFMDLFFGALMIYLLKQDKTSLKFLALIPVALSILSFVAKGIETASYFTENVYWYPRFLRMQYDWLSIFMMLGFYGAYFFADLYFEHQSQFSGLQLDQVKGTNMYRLSVNIISFAVVMIANIIYYLFKYLLPSVVFWSVNTQIAGIAAGVILLLYNGKRGYNAKWFQYGSYLYYPLHIVMLYGIIYLISLI